MPARQVTHLHARGNLSGRLFGARTRTCVDRVLKRTGNSTASRGSLRAEWHAYRQAVSTDSDYVLGTHDEEIQRLALQHQVWRPQAMEAWRRAAIGPGQHVVDLGCGPGFASIDLARLVGPTGRVTAIDRSRRFLQRLRDRAREEGLHNVAIVEQNLDRPALGPDPIDAVWARWAFAFVANPRDLLAALADRMATPGVIVFHEYFDYGTWQTAPPSEELTEFVRAVMNSWRHRGGEPDIALHLPAWLEELGFRLAHVQPLLDVVGPDDPKWRWLAAFIESGRKRLASLGELTWDRAEAIGIVARQWPMAVPRVRMMTPAVLEVIARRSSAPGARRLEVPIVR
jgi:ubiquinone/menaquinone biosynthesis C-methylase UbiE